MSKKKSAISLSCEKLHQPQHASHLNLKTEKSEGAILSPSKNQYQKTVEGLTFDMKLLEEELRLTKQYAANLEIQMREEVQSVINCVSKSDAG